MFTVLHALSSIVRGRVWQAEQMLATARAQWAHSSGIQR